MSIVRTVLGDIAPETLGFTLAHEHLIGKPPPQFAEDDLLLKSEGDAVSELKNFAEVGGNAVVEMTTADYARDAPTLANISRLSDIHIIATTGFNKAKFAERYSARLGEDELVSWMVTELIAGIAEPPFFIQGNPRRTSVRAGIIKGSSSLGGPTVDEEKVLRAVARAHMATGAPVSTHTEKASWALEQAQFLIERGVKPDKLLIGHLDFKPDLEFLSELASTGVYLGLDQFSKHKYLPDAKRVELVVGLFERGFEQILLSGDLARKSYWSVHGGAGFAHLPQKIRPMLRTLGLDDVQVKRLFVDNPREWLRFEPA